MASKILNLHIIVFLIHSYNFDGSFKTSKEDLQVLVDKKDTADSSVNYAQEFDSKNKEFQEQEYLEHIITLLDNMRLKSPLDDNSSVTFAVPTYTAGQYNMITRKLNFAPSLKQIDENIKKSNWDLFHCYVRLIGKNDYLKIFKRHLEELEGTFINFAFIVYFYVFLDSSNLNGDVDSEFIMNLVEELKNIDFTILTPVTVREGLTHQELEYKLIHDRAINSLKYLREMNKELFDKIVKSLDLSTSGNYYLSTEALRVIDSEKSALMIYRNCLIYLPIWICKKFAKITGESIQLIRNSDEIKDAELITENYMKLDRIMYVLSDLYLQMKYVPRSEKQIEFNNRIIMRYPFISKLVGSEYIQPAHIYQAVTKSQSSDSETVKKRAIAKIRRNRYSPYNRKRSIT